MRGAVCEGIHAPFYVPESCVSVLSRTDRIEPPGHTSKATEKTSACTQRPVRTLRSHCAMGSGSKDCREQGVMEREEACRK